MCGVCSKRTSSADRYSLSAGGDDDIKYGPYERYVTENRTAGNEANNAWDGTSPQNVCLGKWREQGPWESGAGEKNPAAWEGREEERERVRERKTESERVL